MPYAMDQKFDGNPLIALRSLEVHFKHIQDTPKVSLVVYPLTPLHVAPAHVPLPRVNIKCFAQEIEGDRVSDARDAFIRRHPTAREILEKENFQYFELQPLEIFFLGGTESGKTDIVKPEDYYGASSDPLAKDMVDILNHINERYSFDLHMFPEEYAETNVDIRSPIFVYFVDRLGFNLMAKNFEGRWIQFRLPFPSPISTKEEVLEAFDNSIENLREKGFESKMRHNRKR
eukprot:TRINITY_DN3551_c0_g1_i3.p1 TRINITY_DN3551_c0_g1~~TRINITY_DN3551_c0_g1_i3.p1  ORF type:complete len:231 (+),score=86.75 TRINITY_DN3551_c0_g1_i3:379-1071(+)